MFTARSSSTSPSQLRSFAKLGLAITWLVILANGVGCGQSAAKQVSATAASHTVSKPFPVSALGHLEPRGEIIQLAAPTVLDGARVEKLLVKGGDLVEQGDLLAVLDSYARKKSFVVEAESRLVVAEAKLAQVLAGAKPGDIAAQAAAVARLEASLTNANQEFERAKTLRANNAISAEDSDKRRMQLDSAQQMLAQGKHQLEGIREVREVDIQLAKAEIASASASVERMRADLETAEVRAPSAGQILKIYALPGEKVGEKGVLDLGDTSRMVAVAEVYEADIHRIKTGQPARVRVADLPELLPGKVVEIGMLVGRKNVLNNDPVADTDARVVEVRIELEAAGSQLVAGLSNARVEAIIDVDGNAPTEQATAPTLPSKSPASSR